MERNMVLTATDRAILESYKTLCEGLANYLGEGYEIALHSLETFDHSVIKIINGYYTGRQEGAPITNLALQMLDAIQSNQSADYVAYISKNKKNEPMHSTTIAIKGEKGRIIGLLCINFYLNTPLAAVIDNIFGKVTEGESQEDYAESAASMLTRTITETQRLVMRDVAIPAHDKNKAIIYRLCQKGVFKLKDSVSQCADILGISRNTVYMHIRSWKEG